MKTITLRWSALALPALLALAGCQTSPDSGIASTNGNLLAEQDAALRAASDSLGVPPPPRAVACSTLTAHLATLDTTAPGFAGLRQAVARVCELLPPPHPDSTRVRPPHPPRPDAARPDTLRPHPPVAHPDSVRPPPPPRPDSARANPGRPDSLPRPPARPDSIRPPHPPRPDSARVKPTLPDMLP